MPEGRKDREDRPWEETRINSMLGAKALSAVCKIEGHVQRKAI